MGSLWEWTSRSPQCWKPARQEQHQCELPPGGVTCCKEGRLFGVLKCWDTSERCTNRACHLETRFGISVNNDAVAGGLRNWQGSTWMEPSWYVMITNHLLHPSFLEKHWESILSVAMTWMGQTIGLPKHKVVAPLPSLATGSKTQFPRKSPRVWEATRSHGVQSFWSLLDRLPSFALDRTVTQSLAVSKSQGVLKQCSRISGSHATW